MLHGPNHQSGHSLDLYWSHRERARYQGVVGIIIRPITGFKMYIADTFQEHGTLYQFTRFCGIFEHVSWEDIAIHRVRLSLRPFVYTVSFEPIRPNVNINF